MDCVSRVRDRLAELELELPQPPGAPAGVVLPFKWVRVSGDHAYVSGHGPLDGSEVLVRGKVGTEVPPERGYDAGRLSVRREAGEHLFHRLLHADLAKGSGVI